jgi:hypothetical protein
MSTKKKQQIKQLRVDPTADKKSIPTRTGRAQTVGTNGPSSAIWQSQPEIQEAGKRLVDAGTLLVTLDASVQSIEAQLATARNLRDAKVVEFDAVFGVYIANAETYATTPQEVTGLGLALFSRSAHPLTAPLGIEATYDIAKGLIAIRVNKAPGLNACVIEVSSEPVGPDTWKRLDGFGGLRKLSDYPAGTHWLRAASARATEVSDFTSPVSVIVK